MTASLEPYTAVLVASYGGPYQSSDVLPFMRNATAGRGIPDERLIEVSQHYELFGGRSPINELNDELMAAIGAELSRRGVEVPIAIGNRNWHPFHAETSAELARAGHTRVVALATSAYHSYSNCRQYAEDLSAGSASVDGAVVYDKVGAFYGTTGFIHANAAALTDAVRRLRAQIGDDAPMRVLFVTHSVPTAMNATSGDGTPETSYLQQHLDVAGAVAAIVRPSLGDLEWELTFCSRSGAPHIPWLEPDINDRLPELPAEGVVGVVACPIGFLSDHMEVLYDLDTQANETAAEAGLVYERAATVGTDPGFISMLVDQLLERAALARGEAGAEVVARYAHLDVCCQPSARPTKHH